MRLNPYIVIMIGLSILLGGLIVFSGCRKKAAPQKHPLETATVEEEVTHMVAPFPGSIGKAVGRIADSARGDISERSANNLDKLYVSGLIMLVASIGLRLFTGSWRDSFILSGLTMVPAAGAVLLTDFPRVVLIVPITGVVVLIAFGIKKALEWRTGYNGFNAVATITEKGDTGPKSWGQAFKNHVAESGMSDVVDKALKPLEKLWKKQAPNAK